ncbi:MAG: hypothetical protein RR189_00610 [Bacilli bacterium]
MSFKGDSKEYAYLKSNSYYFKELNRGTKDFKNFANDMKVKYKERTTDKLNSAIDNIDLISSVLEVLK